MNSIKWFFMSKYKKLLYQIKVCESNEQRLHLSNGVILDFKPGHEYDNCQMFVPFHQYDSEDFIGKYIGKLGQVVHMDVYDGFGGDVKILAIGADRVLIEIVDVTTCYSCQCLPSPGAKYWVGEWEIAPEITTNASPSSFEEKDLPF